MNCKSTGAVARTTWHGLTPSTALHNTNSIFPVVHPNTRLQCPFLNIYQPFSNYGTKTKAIACLTPNFLHNTFSNAIGLSFRVYEIPSYRTSKRANQASCSLATPNHTTLH